MKWPHYFAVFSLSSSTVITALSIPHTGPEHALSIRMPPVEEDMNHDTRFDPDVSHLLPPEQGYDGVARTDEYWGAGVPIPRPPYAYYQTYDPTYVPADDYYVTNMGSSWPVFDQQAQYSTPMIGPGGDFVPTGGIQETYTEAFGLDYQSDLAPVAGPQALPGSYQQTVPQQIKSTDTKEFVSKSEQLRVALEGKAMSRPLPEGVTYVKGGKYVAGLGIPVHARNGKLLYFNSVGNLRDSSKHSYNADGQRANIRSGTLLKDTRKKPKQNVPPNAVQKRESVLGDIQKVEVSSTTNITTSQGQSNQFSKYLTTYYAVQANVSSLILPFIKGIIGSTNNTLIRDVAISAYVEIVGYPIIISSPFVAGMNCLGWLEKQYFEGTNSSVAAITAKPSSNHTSDDIAALHYFASYQTLLSVYNNAYYNGSKVANSTGLLDTLYQLKRYLITNDTSLMPQEFTTVNTDYVKQLFP